MVIVNKIVKNYMSIRKSGNIEQKAVFIIFIILWLMTDLVFSWGTNNFGTAMRHRLKIFPLEILLMYVLSYPVKSFKLRKK